MQIYPVPVRSDNYAYVITTSAAEGTKKKALVVDPFDVNKVLNKVKEVGVDEANIVGILTTHHHDDHAGGNAEFVKRVPHAKVWGGSNQIAALTDKVADKTTLAVDDISIACLHTPCHTQDSICYHLSSSSDKAGAVFTGDTLFIGGCGRFFEGTPLEMVQSLSYLLDGRLPDDTVVFNGHEYTAGNLAFAKSVLGADHQELTRLEGMLKSEGVIGKTNIGDEKKWNVFWPGMFKESKVLQATGKEGNEAVMTALREMKNNFRG